MQKLCEKQNQLLTAVLSDFSAVEIYKPKEGLIQLFKARGVTLPYFLYIFNNFPIFHTFFLPFLLRKEKTYDL